MSMAGIGITAVLFYVGILGAGWLGRRYKVEAENGKR